MEPLQRFSCGAPAALVAANGSQVAVATETNHVKFWDMAGECAHSDDFLIKDLDKEMQQKYLREDDDETN